MGDHHLHDEADALLGLAVDALGAAGEAEAEVWLRRATRGVARFARNELGQHADLVEVEARVRVAHGARVAACEAVSLEKDAVVAAIRDAAALCAVVPETRGFPG